MGNNSYIGVDSGGESDRVMVGALDGQHVVGCEVGAAVAPVTGCIAAIVNSLSFPISTCLSPVS